MLERGNQAVIALYEIDHHPTGNLIERADNNSSFVNAAMSGPSPRGGGNKKRGHRVRRSEGMIQRLNTFPGVLCRIAHYPSGIRPPEGTTPVSPTTSTPLFSSRNQTDNEDDGIGKVNKRLRGKGSEQGVGGLI